MSDHADAVQKQIAALRQQFDDLEKLGAEPGAQVAQWRGNQFEALLLDLFDAHQMLLRRSFHTNDNRSEQIDGAIDIVGRVALVEAKWTKESLAASELFSFLGKVEGKFTGTIGVFVSRATLSTNFLNALRHGRRQSILVIHGDDVPKLFDAPFPLPEYLASCVRHVSIDNVSYFGTQRFLEQRTNKVAAEKATAKDNIKDLLEMLDKPAATNLVLTLVKDKDVATLQGELVALLRAYPRILLKLQSTSPLRSTVPRYIEVGSQRLPTAETDVDRLFLGSNLEGILREPGYYALIRAFSKRLQYVSDELRKATSESLVAAWNDTNGQFEDENILAEPTEALWANITSDAQKSLLRRFVGFVNDYYHRPGFPQYDLAAKMLKSESNRDLRSEVIPAMLVNEYTDLAKMEDPSEAGTRDWAWKSVLMSFAKLRDVVTSGEFAMLEATARKRAGQ
jgi:hypothetical protein